MLLSNKTHCANVFTLIKLQLDVVGKKILFALIFPRATNEKKMATMSNLDLKARRRDTLKLI